MLNVQRTNLQQTVLNRLIPTLRFELLNIASDLAAETLRSEGAPGIVSFDDKLDIAHQLLIEMKLIIGNREFGELVSQRLTKAASQPKADRVTPKKAAHIIQADTWEVSVANGKRSHILGEVKAPNGDSALGEGKRLAGSIYAGWYIAVTRLAFNFQEPTERPVWGIV